MPRPLTLYHFTRRDGTPVFVHPLVERGSTLRLPLDGSIIGVYGREPRVESLTLLRNELYRRVEEDVRDWINERRFIPRFLIAAGAFLIVYLAFAIAIRDPLPVLDEVILAFIAGAAAFIFVGRRFEQSKVAMERRVALRSKIDGAVFSEDPAVARIEALFHQLDAMADDPDTEVSEALTEEARTLWNDEPEHCEALLHALRRVMAQQPYRGLERSLRRGTLRPRQRIAVENGTVTLALPRMAIVLRDAARRPASRGA